MTLSQDFLRQAQGGAENSWGPSKVQTMKMRQDSIICIANARGYQLQKTEGSKGDSCAPKRPFGMGGGWPFPACSSGSGGCSEMTSCPMGTEAPPCLCFDLGAGWPHSSVCPHRPSENSHFLLFTRCTGVHPFRPSSRVRLQEAWTPMCPQSSDLPLSCRCAFSSKL